MQQVESKQKQSTFKWAMTLKSHYFVKWMQVSDEHYLSLVIYNTLHTLL